MAIMQRCLSGMDSRLPAVSETQIQTDFFDRMRRIVVVVMLAAGVAAILGSVLDWVVITERPSLRPGFDFQEQNERVEEPEVTEPFSGVDATYGIYSLAGGVILIVAGLLLLRIQRGRFAWLGFAAAISIGGIAVAAFRGIADTSSDLYQEMDIVGRAEPALGLIMVGTAGVVGLIASGVGVAATPYRRPEEEPA